MTQWHRKWTVTYSIIYCYLFSFIDHGTANWQSLIMCYELTGGGARMHILSRVMGSLPTLSSWRHDFKWCGRWHCSSTPPPYQGGSLDLLTDLGQLSLLQWHLPSLLMLGHSGAGPGQSGSYPALNLCKDLNPSLSLEPRSRSLHWFGSLPPHTFSFSQVLFWLTVSHIETDKN